MDVRWDVGSGPEALARLSKDPVEILLMDLNLGEGMSGIDVTRTVAVRHPEVRVVVITALSEERVAWARAAGAAAFLPKHLPVDDLVRGIERASGLTTTTWSPQQPAAAVRQQASDRTPTAMRLVELAILTRREAEVLAEVRDGRTNREIALRLGVSTPTVNKHVHQILTKLHARNRAHAASMFEQGRGESA
jgi:DNA-binding NarL/FixJ family response regulator